MSAERRAMDTFSNLRKQRYIRRGQSDDVDKLYDCGMFNKNEWTVYRSYIMETFETGISGRGILLVAIEKRRLIGQIFVDLWTYQKKRQGAIFDLKVVPEWRGRKVGTSLIHHAEQIIKDCDSLDAVHIGVEYDNDYARSLYERLGYRLSEEGISETFEFQNQEINRYEKANILTKNVCDL